METTVHVNCWCLRRSFVIPFILQFLYNAYAWRCLSTSGMDPGQTLNAPQAGLMALVAQGVFTYNYPGLI